MIQPAVPEQARLLPRHQTPLTLVQMWQDQLEPRTQLLPVLIGYSHTTTTSPDTRSNVLFRDGFTMPGT